MRYKFFINSLAAWNAMCEAIAGAKESVYLEFYIFHDDAETHRFLDLLKAKAKAGIQVKIVLDSLGSFQFFGNLQESLKKEGIELLYFNRLLPWWNPHSFRRWWFLRTHRKLLIVDGRVGFIGGVNIGKRFKNWHDLQLRLEGVIVGRLAKSFARSYRISGGRDRLLIPQRPATAPDSKVNIALLEHWPAGGRSFFKKFYKEKISKARESVVMVTPYFAPHLWLMRVIKKAIRRGVRVEVILPKEADLNILNSANHIFMEAGHHIGIVFYLFPEMIHAKALLVDGAEGMVGSNNIDAMGFDYNVEASVGFSDARMVGDLRSILSVWKERSEIYTEPKTRKWYHAIVRWVIKILQPFL